ncbi:MAG TPA: GAF domain-containing protein [Thermoanaerobaculia bacterium]|nr:GAF domain-containing protein [Thermoanaerobaculia bacterium]
MSALAHLASLAELLRGAPSVRDAMRSVFEAMPHIVPADAYAIWRYVERAQEWQVIASAGLSREYVSHTISERRDESVLRDGPFFVENVYAWPLVAERRAFYEEEGIRSLFVIPLHFRGSPAGTLACYLRAPRPITDEEHQLARITGDIVSAALSVRKFDRFAEAARVTSAELDLQHIVQTVTDAATELTNAQFGAFFYNVLDDQGGSYTLYTISGVPREAFSRFPMPRNTQVFAPTFAGTATVRSNDIRKDPRYARNAPYHGMPKGHLPVVSYLAVPVISRSGEVLGGLFFGHEEEGVFTENEEQIVEALAAQAAVAIDNARLYEALQRERGRLAVSEARYRALVTAAPTRQIIWTTSPEGRVTDDIPAWRDFTGQSFEELREQWTSILHPDDRERVTISWEHAIRSREPFEQQYRVRMRDGSYRWMSVTGVPVLRDDGTVVEWVGTSIDVHERKIADDTLRFLATASDLLASSLDYETTLRTVANLVVPEIADWCAVDVIDDDGQLRRLAVAHVDPRKIELAHELQQRYPSDPEMDVVARVIRTGRAEWMAEIPQELLDAAAVDDEHRRILHELGLLSFIVAPLRIHDRALGTITYVLSDSRRRFSESDVAFAEELGRRAAVAIENSRLFGAVQSANRTKDEFLATLSHELRTPMTAVLGWARMLKMGLSPAEAEEAVDVIERSASIQMQLIEDILDMSRIMAGKIRIDTVAVDLCAVSQAALATVHPAATAKQIEIVTEFPERAPAVLGDEGRLQQVVWNLLTNAIKFTPRGGTVMLRVAVEGEDVRLDVRDSGVGIDAGFLPHVFEPFRQQDSSTTRAHGGIGLGLAIVRHLVELHGGRIRAESGGPGRGARFTVVLPALASRRSAHDHSTDDSLASLEGLDILVIDDEPMTRDVVIAVLRRSGARVVAAESARDAHELLVRMRPDAIVCDIAMPGEDGYTFVRLLREREPELARIPVIALTAFGRTEDREKALRSGFDGYLKKPVDPRVLAETLRAKIAG